MAGRSGCGDGDAFAPRLLGSEGDRQRIDGSSPSPARAFAPVDEDTSQRVSTMLGSGLSPYPSPQPALPERTGNWCIGDLGDLPVRTCMAEAELKSLQCRKAGPG